MATSGTLASVAVLLLGMPLTGNAETALSSVSVSVCYSYGCSNREQVFLSDWQWQALRAIFTPSAASAKQERAAIRLAIANMEILTGTVVGTWADMGRNSGTVDKTKQMDCIDESTNTTSYLMLFQQTGLLIWHEVAERHRRSKWIVDVHWTAVIREKETGQHYAVDSWHLDNGQPPYIQTLEDWQTKKDFE